MHEALRKDVKEMIKAINAIDINNKKDMKNFADFMSFYLLALHRFAT